MKMNKNLLSKLFVVLFGCSLCACSDDDDNITDKTPTAAEFNINRAVYNTTFDQEAVILGVNGDDAKNVAISLIYLLPNFNIEVTDSTKLLIVPELSKEYEKEISKVYNNGGIVAVTAPTQDQLTRWFDAYHWDSGIVPGNVDDALLFSFSKGYHCCLVYGPDSKNVIVDSEAIENMPDKDSEDFIYKDFSTEGAAIDSTAHSETGSDDADNVIWIDFQNPKYPEVYTYLSSWLDVVNNDINKVGLTKNESEEVKEQLLSLTRANGNDDSEALDVSEIFARYPYSIVAPFTARGVVRWLAGDSDPDIIKGTGAVTVSFNVYQIHCYEDQPSGGDYYLVNMTAGLASADMYKGKWWNQHGGSYVRICGFYAKSFEVECTPYHSTNSGWLIPYSSSEVEVLETPKPLTTVGKTQYEDSFTFGVTASISVSGGSSVVLTPYFQVDPKLSFGWQWSEQSVRTISDTDISNISGGSIVNGTTVSKVGWKMTFNNLPEYDWGEDYGFDEGTSLTYRSTNYLHANWVWYQKDVKDDSNQDPIAIHVQVKPTFGALSFITTDVSLHENLFNFGCVDQYINLKPFSRDRCGVINLKNDFTDNTAITDIQIYRANSDATDGDLAWSTENTLKAGKTVTTPALKVADRYNIYFSTNTGKRYKYTTYPSLEIEIGMENTINSNINFTEVTR